MENFSQYFPDKRPEINNNTKTGIVISHNDDFMRYVRGNLVFNESNSWWFGWSQNHNPFQKDYPGPEVGDTIVNYTQRRIKWIHDWLVNEGVIDENKVAIQGYSVGSAGTTAMVKTYPEIFSVASVFNCGHRGPDEDNFGSLLLGQESLNLPTNLKDRNGNVLGIHDMYNLEHRVNFSDWPLIRSWHGKNDINPTMKWSPEFLAKVRYADSLGLGYHLYWDERDHPISGIMTHWSNGPAPHQQTGKDDTADQEKYRNDSSYPVFFNYRNYNIHHNDPGNGEKGTGQGNGNDWGSWGGYHEFDIPGIVDENNQWSCIIYLSGEGAREIDRYGGEEDCIQADFTIRRSQKFKLAPLEEFKWELIDMQGMVIQSGIEVAEQDGTPIIRGLYACRDPKKGKNSIKSNV